MRAWLQVDYVGSTWTSHNGSSIQPDYDAWRSVPDQDYCTVDVLPLPTAAAQGGFGTFGFTNDDAGNAKLGDSFSVPVQDCTESTDAAIQPENAKLKADNERLLKQADRMKRKRRRETRKAARARKKNDMGGCQQVTIAEMAPRVTGLEGVQLVSEVDSAEPALGGGDAAMKKRCRVKGEVAQDKLMVELNGGKAIRRATSGKKLGGLEWKDSVMAGAVANWAMN
jgi:hypothetical protein